MSTCTDCTLKIPLKKMKRSLAFFSTRALLKIPCQGSAWLQFVTCQILLSSDSSDMCRVRSETQKERKRQAFSSCLIGNYIALKLNCFNWWKNYERTGIVIAECKVERGQKKKNKGYLFSQNQELQMSSYLYHVLMPSFPNSRSQEYFIRTYILVYLES